MYLVQSACVMMCATGFAQLNYVTKLPISTFEGLVCRHLKGICHVIVTQQVTINFTFCTDIILFYVFIINEKLHTYQTPPSSGNIVPVTSSQVYSSVPVTCYTYDLSVLS